MDRAESWKNLLSEADSYYNTTSEPEREHMREWVKGLLAEQAVTVDFIKANGEFRSMKCTLSEALGAKYTMNENSQESQKKPNPEVCVVWDVNQNAWRSFRWDRMKRITFDLG